MSSQEKKIEIIDEGDRKKHQSDRERNAAKLQQKLLELQKLLEKMVPEESERNTKLVKDVLAQEAPEGKIHAIVKQLATQEALEDRDTFENQTISSLFENITKIIAELQPMAMWGEKWLEEDRVKNLEKKAKEIELKKTIDQASEKSSKAGF